MPRRLADVDLSKSMSKADAEDRISRAQRHLLHLRLITGGLIGDGRLGPGILILMEWWDDAGKGGSIKRVTAPIDPRHVQVVSVGAPTPDELRHHFLWRFFPPLPGLGGMVIFDRTWYGRVLVERVEGFCKPSDWERAYGEIASFEESLVAEGLVIIKLFLHLSDEEQLRRFEARQNNPLKSWKLTDEDWRNRAKRAEYEESIDIMLERTHTDAAPWHVIPGDSKHYARVAVLETIIREVEAAMRRHGIEPPPSKGLDFGV